MSAAPVRARSRRTLAVAIVVLLVAVVGAVVVVAVRHGRSGDACSAIPLAPPAGAPADAMPIAAGEVVLFVSGSNGLASWSGISLIIARDGTAVALAHGDSVAAGVTYRRAQLGADTVEAVRACLNSAAFQSLAATYDSNGFTTDNGHVCQIGDATTFVVSAGPASGTDKSVSAYALGDELGGCSDSRSPALPRRRPRARSDLDRRRHERRADRSAQRRPGAALTSRSGRSRRRSVAD